MGRVLKPQNFSATKASFWFQALDPLVLPAAKGNLFRGLFGVWWQRQGVASLSWERLFRGKIDDPRAHAEGIQFLPNWTLSVSDNRTYLQSGEKVRVDLTIVGKELQVTLMDFLLALETGSRNWIVQLGPKEHLGRAAFLGATTFDPSQGTDTWFFDPEDDFIAEPVIVDWEFVKILSAQLDPRLVTIEFLTPTRIREQGKLIDDPSFPIVFESILRRSLAILRYHCGEELEINTADLLVRADNVQMVEDQTKWIDWGRTSHSQKTHMRLGGFTGKVSYQGKLKPFLPYLALAQIIGIGKGTTFGNGVVSVE